MFETGTARRAPTAGIQGIAATAQVGGRCSTQS